MSRTDESTPLRAYIGVLLFVGILCGFFRIDPGSGIVSDGQGLQRSAICRCKTHFYVTYNMEFTLL